MLGSDPSFFDAHHQPHSSSQIICSLLFITYTFIIKIVMKGEHHQNNQPSARNLNNINLSQIRIHIKTQKNSKPPFFIKNNHTKSTPPRQKSNELPSEVLTLQKSHKARRDTSPNTLLQVEAKMRWNIGGVHEINFKKTTLPQITEYRGKTDQIEIQPIRRDNPSRSMKIQFRELIPIKEITKEQKTQNLRKIRDQFKELVNTSNNILVRNRESSFKAYVQKGNNGILVKQLLKKRWWWHLQQKAEKANLLWTQWFNKAFTETMPELTINENTPGNDYNRLLGGQQPKMHSIRMILDQSTFTKIRPRISLRDQHYLRSHKPSHSAKNTHQSSEMELKEVSSLNHSIHNHIDGCLQLHSKKLLFKNLYTYLKKKGWDPFQFIPVTYYVQSRQSEAFQDIESHFYQIESTKASTSSHNLWILKPGQNSNRGFGITMHSDIQELKGQLRRRLSGQKRSVIVQKYMQECFLVNKRKFDIRCYILITTVNGNLKGYWYNDGYIRTSSQEYDLNDFNNKMIHLTNDAVQKHHHSYGKYEDYNKMTFNHFKKYLSKVGLSSPTFDASYQQMKTIAYYLIASVTSKIRRKQYTYQLFGLDFMLDHKLKPFLIQANSNPCLDTSGGILGTLIPELIDNVLMTAVDPLFPPPDKSKAKEYLSKDYFRSNKFQLIFNESKMKKREVN